MRLAGVSGACLRLAGRVRDVRRVQDVLFCSSQVSAVMHLSYGTIQHADPAD